TRLCRSRDVVMTNIRMSAMNGWELAERIRYHDPHVPIIFMTGWGLQSAGTGPQPEPGRNFSALFNSTRPAALHPAVEAARPSVLRAGATNAAVSGRLVE